MVTVVSPHHRLNDGQRYWKPACLWVRPKVDQSSNPRTPHYLSAPRYPLTRRLHRPLMSAELTAEAAPPPSCFISATQKEEEEQGAARAGWTHS